jgi:hypothetical protein
MASALRKKAAAAAVKDEPGNPFAEELSGSTPPAGAALPEREPVVAVLRRVVGDSVDARGRRVMTLSWYRTGTATGGVSAAIESARVGMAEFGALFPGEKKGGGGPSVTLDEVLRAIVAERELLEAARTLPEVPEPSPLGMLIQTYGEKALAWAAAHAVDPGRPAVETMRPLDADPRVSLSQTAYRHDRNTHVSARVIWSHVQPPAE